ncbi:thiamine-phosphate kinase [Cohnella silvisoli]|uniref:Thiamine-monophosphate kinase n=1 Tax=Cohnella silvisoli TaxID=2873699 RepID=A0ABV1KVS8_9BACL|nr:thiamine-phosphate kinase [Cohnella silvisoli]MCD9023617.1 thiamine-phosphate kinase [Cohnella silvisoli]
MPPLDEFGLIRVWTEGRQSKEMLAKAGVTLGIGDDAAVVAGSSGQEWLFAMDTMVEEIHFRNETMSESDVGYKALAANISDIAAMGGMPKFALVSVSVPPQWDSNRMKQLYDGVYMCAEKYGVAVIGGDTTSAPRHLVVSVTVIGSIEAGKAIRRSGAKAGQFVFLTGPTGLSAGGLHGLLKKPADEGGPDSVPVPPHRLVQAHQRPSPSVKAGRILLEQGWGASLNDVSDGVASEAWEIAEASHVKLVLKETHLPLSGELVAYARDNGIHPLDWVLYGGEDYVLLGTADKRHELAMKEHFRAEGIPLFIIGEVEAGQPEVILETSAGASKPIHKRGYNHFPKGYNE